MLNLKKIWRKIFIFLQYRLSLLLLASMEWNIQPNTMADPTWFRLSLHDLNTTQQSWNYIFRKNGNNNNHLPILICTKTCSKSQLLSMLGLAIHQVQHKTFKSTPTYPMSCDEKYEGYSTSKRNKTLQRQFDRNHFNLPMNSL